MTPNDNLTLEAPLDVEAVVESECQRLKIPPFNDATDWQDRLARTLVLYRLGAAAERDAVESDDDRRFWQGEFEIYDELLKPLENGKPLWRGEGKRGRGAHDKFLVHLSRESRIVKGQEKHAETDGERLFHAGRFKGLQKTRTRAAQLTSLKNLTGKRGYRAKR